MEFVYDVEIVHLLASSVHRYEGRPSEGPRPAPEGEPESRERIEVRASFGIVGDRHFGHPAHRTAAVTVMAEESLEYVREALQAGVLDPAATRRNIILRGVDVDRLRGAEFSLDSGDAGEVRFRAHRPANPCAWMDVVLAPGAHKALRGRGGMRCEPLSDGVLRLGPAVLRSSVDVARHPTLV